MKKIILIGILLFIANYTMAQYAGQVASNMSAGAGQNTVAAAAISNLLGPVSEAYQKTREIELDKFVGTPYTANSFTPTTLYYKEENLGKIYYRYNALNEEIEIKKKPIEETYKALAKDKDISITVDNNKMSFKTFVTEKKRTENGYLSMLLDGKDYDLYKRIHVKFTEGQPAQNSFVPAVPGRFSHFTEYYFQKKGVNRIDEIPLKNNKLLKLLEGSNREEVKAYLKENNLNIKEEADLIKVFEFLNE